jgi:hypothetical protein
VEGEFNPGSLEYEAQREITQCLFLLSQNLCENIRPKGWLYRIVWLAFLLRLRQVLCSNIPPGIVSLHGAFLGLSSIHTDAGLRP